LKPSISVTLGVFWFQEEPFSLAKDINPFLNGLNINFYIRLNIHLSLANRIISTRHRLSRQK